MSAPSAELQAEEIAVLADTMHEYLAPHPHMGKERRKDGSCLACWLVARTIVRSGAVIVNPRPA